MTPEQQKAALKLANAIDLFLHGGITRGAELPDLLRTCETLEINPDDLQDFIANAMI
jgi:hypothetical protein